MSQNKFIDQTKQRFLPDQSELKGANWPATYSTDMGVVMRRTSVFKMETSLLKATSLKITLAVGDKISGNSNHAP